MEKFSQFRDKGSGIAPFLPIPTDPSGVYLPFHAFLFAVRLPFLIAFILSYFFFLQWLPIGAVGKKASLWCILGVPGIWWIDLQIDGVKRGSVSRNSSRLPQGGSIIASSSTSPIDPLYLAAIFDPIFTASFSNTRKVQHISLLHAVYRAFTNPQATAPASTSSSLTDLDTLVAQNPDRVIVVFPECTTSNGRGILPLSPSLLSSSSTTKIFPISLRYTAPDITTPVPHSYFTFLWNLCSKPTHCIRIRLAEVVYNTSRKQADVAAARTSSYETNSLDRLDVELDGYINADEESGDEVSTGEERAFLDRIAEALARLGRVKRVGLGVKEKEDFVSMWKISRSRR